MARQEVAFDEVAAAASKLQKDGKEVSLDAVREALVDGSPAEIYKHLSAWRAKNIKPPKPPKAELPPEVIAGLVEWAKQYAEESSAGMRDSLAQAADDAQALLRVGEELESEGEALNEEVANIAAERDVAQVRVTELTEEIERLNAELRNAKQVAMDALVSKAKDQLAIDGKDKQLADLRAQLERNVATTAAESDARLAAETELVGATTARDSLANEVKELRAQLETSYSQRSALRAELEVLKSKK